MGATASTESPSSSVSSETVETPEKIDKILQVILIDRSSSMNVGNYGKTVADNIVLPTVQRLSSQCNELTLHVSTFATKLIHVVQFQKMNEKFTSQLRDFLPTVAHGGTRYYDSVVDTIASVQEHLKSNHYDRVGFTVFTDGQDTCCSSPSSEKTMNETIDRVRDQGWVLSFVGIEFNVATSTKSAQKQECMVVTSHFEKDEFEKCIATTSGRLLSAAKS